MWVCRQRHFPESLHLRAPCGAVTHPDRLGSRHTAVHSSRRQPGQVVQRWDMLEQQELASTAARTGVGWGSGGLPGSVRWRRVGRRRRGGEEAAGGSMVFGASQDPVIIDGALISDGESSRGDRPGLRGPGQDRGGRHRDRAVAGGVVGGQSRRLGSGRSIFATSRSTMASRSTPRPSASTSSAGTTSPASCRAPRCPTTGAR